MSETQSSFPEERDESARPQRPAAKSQSAFARTLEHDARTPLSVIENSLSLIQLQTQNKGVLEATDVARSKVQDLSIMLKEAIEREPLPETALSKVHEMMAEVLKRICEQDQDDRLAGKCRFEMLDDSSTDCAAEEIPEESVLRIRLNALPPELKRDKIPCSLSALLRIFDNLINNSIRKKATRMDISIRRAGHHEVAVSISDDGPGMKLKILQNIRSGVGDTDKTDKDGIKPGETKKDHGHGIGAVRQIVEERSGGKMEIFSIKKENLDDTGGEQQDEASIGQHPFAHGVTFRFTYEVKNMEPNGDSGSHPVVAIQEAPDAPVEPDRSAPEIAAAVDSRIHYSRRQLFGMATGAALATAASAAGVSFYLGGRRESNVLQQPNGVPSQELGPESPASPLSHFAIDDDGGLVSFAFNARGKQAVYERGRPLPDAFMDVRTVPLDGGSLTVIDPAMMINAATNEKLQLRKMFVCAVPEGVFCYADIPQGRSQQRGYLCAGRHQNEDDNSLSSPALHLLTDAVFNTYFEESITGVPRTEKLKERNQFDATSIKMLESPTFETMYDSLLNTTRLLKRQSQHTSGASLNFMRTQLIKILNTGYALKNKKVSAKNLEELSQYLALSGRFIIADEKVVEALRHKPLPPEGTRMAEEHDNTVCLPGVSPTEAYVMIRHG